MAVWPISYVEQYQMTPSGVRRLFGLLVLLAACFLLLELHYLRNSCPQSSDKCLHSSDASRRDSRMLSERSISMRREQSSEQRTKPPSLDKERSMAMRRVRPTEQGRNPVFINQERSIAMGRARPIEQGRKPVFINQERIAIRRAQSSDQRTKSPSMYKDSPALSIVLPSKQQRPMMKQEPVALPTVPPSKQQRPMRGQVTPQQTASRQTSVPKLGSRDSWIIADVTSGRCRGHVDVPPGWRILRTSQLEGDNSTGRMTLSPDLKALKNVRLDPHYLWAKKDAYLLAIARGAQRILQTDCSVPVMEAVQLMEADMKRDFGMMYNETLLFNPYAHFGAWALAPAAAPQMGLWNNSQLYYVREFRRVFSRHILTDQSADATVVMSGKHHSGITFDPSSAPVYVGQRSFTPALPGCSLYHRQAFWALLDPCDSSSAHCLVLWRLLQQRLFRELDAFSAFYQMDRSMERSRRKEKVQITGGDPLMKVVTFLDAWKCRKDYRFYQCFSSLMDQLKAKGFFTREQKATSQEFVSAVQSLGVAEPTRVSFPWHGDRKIGEFRVKMGNVNTSLESEGRAKEKSMQTRLLDTVFDRCSQSPSGGHFVPLNDWKKPAIEDVVLIVSFNKVLYFWRNIAYLETAYRPYFKHIAYCVTDMDAIAREDDQNILSHMTLVEGLTTYWYLMYGCATVLMQMKLQGVKGYVQIGDDTLLNPWGLFNTSHDVTFQHSFGTRINAKQFFVRPHWKWWRGPQGRCPLLKVMAELEDISGLSKDQLLRWAGTSSAIHVKDRRNTFTEIRQGDMKGRQPPVTQCDPLPGTEVWPRPTRQQAQTFLYNYYKLHNMSGHFVGQTQDFFYLPQSLADPYVAVSHLFMRHQVIVELALHAIQVGITAPEKVRLVQGSSLWHADRYTTEKFFNASHFYLHPFKYKYTLRDHLRNFYCDVYLKTLADRLKAFRP